MSAPISFPKSNDLPIVGQPLKLGAWFPTLNIICNCEAQQSLLLVGFGTVTACPHCRRGFRLHAVAFDIRTGEPPNFHIDIVLPSRPESPHASN